MAIRNFLFATTILLGLGVMELVVIAEMRWR
jgi:hypothetical protein